MGNATSWSIWLGVVVACFVMVGYSVRGQTRSPVLGVLVLGIGLLAGWATVSALLRRNPIFFVIVFGTITLLALAGAVRQFSAREE
jgi:hypothetical protein